MTPAWTSPTLVTLGLSGALDWLESSTDVVLLVDRAVQDQAPALALDRWVHQHDARLLRLVVERPPTLDDLTGLVARTESFLAASPPASTAMVAVGGGATIDLATLASLVHLQPRALALITSAQRSGLVLLPQTLRRTLPLGVIPTTLGTGAELSSSACVDTAHGRRLVVGEALRPDLATLDPEATSTLPVDLAAEAVLEALFRVTSMLIGQGPDQPVEDALALTLADELMRCGDALAHHRETSTIPDDLRMDIAKLSGLSQSGWLTLGRNRYAAKGWYVATELSQVLGCRKMSAVARILPALWHSIDAGHLGWGDADRLDHVWTHLRTSSPLALPPRAPAGINHLIEAWRIAPARTITSDETDAVVRRSMRAWGSGLPMLYGLRSKDVRDMLDIAYSPTHGDVDGEPLPSAAPQATASAAPHPRRHLASRV